MHQAHTPLAAEALPIKHTRPLLLKLFQYARFLKSLKFFDGQGVGSKIEHVTPHVRTAFLTVKSSHASRNRHIMRSRARPPVVEGNICGVACLLLLDSYLCPRPCSRLQAHAHAHTHGLKGVHTPTLATQNASPRPRPRPCLSLEACTHSHAHAHAHAFKCTPMLTPTPTPTA